MSLINNLNHIKTEKHNTRILVERSEKDEFFAYTINDPENKEKIFPVTIYQSYHALLQQWAPDVLMLEFWRLNDYKDNDIILKRGESKTLGWSD